MDKTYTLTLMIGNTDNKLSQRLWSDFYREMNNLIQMKCQRIHFSGGSSCVAEWQNYCWVFDIASLDDFISSVKSIRSHYLQDSVAVTMSDNTLFV